MLIKIQGMGCMRCVAKVRKVVEEIGATVVSCEIGTCIIEPFEDRDKIRAAIEGVGFDLVSIEES